jgi:DNA transposition AAA+ family ATPase
MPDEIQKPLTTQEIDVLLHEDVESALLEEVAEDFIHTSASRIIISRLDAARRNRYPFVLVSGPAGSGKSMTVREYARDKDVGYVRCYPDFGPADLVGELVSYLALNNVSSWRMKLSMLRSALGQRHRMVILDEAQLITRKGLEAAKYLADEATTTFVLVMTDEFVNRIQAWRDIDSRTGVTAAVAPVSLTEFRALFDNSGFRSDTLDEIHTITAGVMRDITRLVRLVDELCQINARAGLTRGQLQPRHVRLCAEKLNLRGGR